MTTQVQQPQPVDAQHRIADAWVHVQCAYTSLERLNETGLLARERPFFARLAPRFQTIVLVSYGARDAELVRSLMPPGFSGRVVSIDNSADVDPGLFQAGVPERVRAALDDAGARTALVYTDQHYGGAVAVGATKALRAHGVRTGLIARGGYHWSRFEAHDFGPASVRAMRSQAQEGELCRAADLVIGSTVRMVDDLAWLHGLPSSWFRLVPNFVVDAGPVASFEKRETSWVLSVGRLEAQKRHDLLIKAAALAAKTHPHLRVTIIGAGTLREELTRLIEKLGAPVEIKPRVKHEELHKLMGACRVYAQVSSLEGHPKTIIEALSCGAPTLVTRASGVDDELAPGRTGLVTEDSPEAVADGLRLLLDDAALASRVGAAAASDVRARLSFDVLAPRYEQAMAEAMSTAGAHAMLPPAGVRFDPALMMSPASVAAGEFAGAIKAFARRLSDEDRAVFLESIAQGVDGAVGAR